MNIHGGGPTFYRKKPIVVEAMRYDGSAKSVADLLDFMGEIQMFDCLPVIDTLEGRMVVGIGDWVIRGVTGEFYPCKHEVFIQSYDEEPEHD